MSQIADFLAERGEWDEADSLASNECAGARACSLRQAPVDEWGEIAQDGNACTLTATCGQRASVLAGEAEWRTVRVERTKPAPAAMPDMSPAESAMWDELKAKHRQQLRQKRVAMLASAGLPANTPRGSYTETEALCARPNPVRTQPQFQKATPLGVSVAVREMCERASGLLTDRWAAGIRRVVDAATQSQSVLGQARERMARIEALEDEFGAALDWVVEDRAICDRAEALADRIAHGVQRIYDVHGVSLADDDSARQRLVGAERYAVAAKTMRALDLQDWLTMQPAPRPQPITDTERATAEATVASTWDALRDAVDFVAHKCRLHHVDPPQLTPRVQAHEAVRGAIARASSVKWWRRNLRKAARRIIEAGAIKLGTVNRRTGGYCSNHALKTRREQLRRNANALATTTVMNEAGQMFTLAELAASSVSNPVNRGGELMTRIRGCEEYADAAGHVGLFITLTCPSAMHRMLAKVWQKRGAPAAAARAYDEAAGAYQAVPNKKWDGVTTPRLAQQWLVKRWSLARSAIQRRKLKVYGFRVAEPHHDGTPHWHALVWCETQADANKLQALLYDYWVKRDKTYASEKGAAQYRTNFKRMEAGGAAGYIAKYISKSIGHHALAEHWDSVGSDLFTVEMGDAAGQGHERVDAWASSWGIRQFQSIGQPSVGLWRELRRVTEDQVKDLDWQTNAQAKLAWDACQKQGDKPADWAEFLRALGGVCLRRGDYRLQPACRTGTRQNLYGEHTPLRKVVGVVTQAGNWLISRRQLWRPVTGTPEAVQAKQRIERGETPQDEAERAARGAPWTGFNNCTARLTQGRANELCAAGEAQAQAEENRLIARYLAPIYIQQLEMFGATADETAQVALLHADALMQRLCMSRRDVSDAMTRDGWLLPRREYAKPAPLRAPAITDTDANPDLDAAMDAMADALGYA